MSVLAKRLITVAVAAAVAVTVGSIFRALAETAAATLAALP